MIPVSTFDLFLQDDIEALMSHHFDTSNSKLPESLVNSEFDKSRALKGRLDKHNSQMEELRIDRQLLLDENTLMKRQLAKLTLDLSVVRKRVKGAVQYEFFDGSPSPSTASSPFPTDPLL